MENLNIEFGAGVVYGSSWILLKLLEKGYKALWY